MEVCHLYSLLRPPTKLSNTFKSVKNVSIGSQTISNYLTFLSESFLLNKAIRYDIKGKKYINTLSKYYFSDIGLRNAILDMRQQEETHIMENIIYNELITRGYSVDVGMVEIKKQDKDGKWVRIQLEVDFIASLGSKKYYVQKRGGNTHNRSFRLLTQRGQLGFIIILV